IPAVLQYLHTLLIRPIVQDPLEHVRVGLRNFLEKVHSRRPAACREPICFQLLPRAFDDMRNVGDHTSQMTMHSKDPGEEAAVAATEIHYCPGRSKVVCARNCGC